MGVRGGPGIGCPGPAVRVEQAGDLIAFGVFTQVAVRVDGGDPAGRGADRCADWLVIAVPTENRMSRCCSRRERMWARKS